MRIVLIASEEATDGRGGGVGAMLAALPRSLAERGHEVAVFLPLPQGRRQDFRPVEEVGALPVRLHDGHEEAELLRAAADEPGARLFAIGADRYFDRATPFGTAALPRADGLRKSAFFCRAVLGAVDALGLEPDILHCHDWPTALVPVYLRGGMVGADRAAQARERLGRARIVLTVHDLSFQGVFPSPDFAAAGVPRGLVALESVEAHGTVNVLREGLLRADHVTTASPRHARDVRSVEHGAGLHDVFEARAGAVSGILCGIDASVWNPASDSHLVAGYGPTDFHEKRRCKADLLLEMNLDADLDAPVAGVLSPLQGDRGFDVLLPALPALFERGLRVAVVGEGSPRIEEALRDRVKQWPGRLAFQPGWDPPAVHRLLAGADLLVVAPSYEPGGWEAMVAQAYGAVPVVRAVGGLVDSVLDVVAVPDRGTGFWIDHDSPDALLRAVDRALAAFAEPDVWRAVQVRGAARDFSWRHATARFVQLFRRLVHRSIAEEPAPRLERGSWHGRLADEFTVTALRAVAQGLAEQLFEADPAEALVQRGVLVAHDTRLCGSAFAATAAGVLAWNDVSVAWSERPVALPAVARAVAVHRLAGALVVTGEATGAGWNGVHLLGPSGAPLSAEAAAVVDRRSAPWLARPRQPEEMGAPEATELRLRRVVDPREAHRRLLETVVDVDAVRGSGLRVACDLRWGTAAATLDSLLRDWGVAGEILHDGPDPTFGELGPEPTPDTLAPLVARVGSDHDLGIAVDPSGTRLGIVARGGRILCSDHVLALLLGHLAETRDLHGRTVARSVDTSHLVDAVARHFDLDLIETPSGFQELGELLRRGEIFFAADGNAFAFGDAVPHPDAILGALLVVEMVARRRRSLEEQLGSLFETIDRRFLERRRFDVPVRHLDRVRRALAEPPERVAGWTVRSRSDLDGARLLLDGDRWLLARLSVEGPALHVTAEAATAAEVEALLRAGAETFLPPT